MTLDILTKEKRSWVMSRIHGHDTGPELVVRSTLHRMGYRFRIHRKDLPGRPDVVLPKLKTVVLVHGCFWHRHRGCRFAYDPGSRQEFWQKKFAQNVERDKEVSRILRCLGWRVLVIWECQTRSAEQLSRRLAKALHSRGETNPSGPYARVCRHR